MVVLSLRNRQNRECVDEDLRANKKVFEREQQQIAIMPQSEMPPNDKIQAIAFQFNKDIENVKNALNDGLTDMNTPDAIQRGFADFSKVSLAWNKLVARVNPYLKGQQTDPDFQAATAGDYNYVRQKLKDDLLQFFANGIQQINSFKRGLAAQGGVARVQNEASLVDIAQQLGTGFYKNVKYGAEGRTSLLIPRLPPDVGQQGQQGQPPPANPPPAPQPAPAPLQPFQPQQLTQGDIRLFDEYDQIHGQATPITDANAAVVAQQIEQDMFDALPQQRQRQVTQQQRAGERQRIEALVPEMVQYIAYQQALQQQQQAPAPPPQQQGQPAPAPPAPARRGRPVDMNRQQAIFDKANELGIFQQLTGYAQKTQAERQRVAPFVRQLAAELQISPEALKRNLNQMVGFGRSSGGFLGSILSGLAGDAYRGTTGNSFGSDLMSLGKMAFNNRGVIGDALKNKFNQVMTDAGKRGNGRGQTPRGRPLRLANNFTGTSVEPNTLADLKNRYRGKSYIGTMTGDIDPTLQNSSVLGSARRMERTRMEGEGVAEVLDAISRMGRLALENLLLPALRALGRAIVSGVQLGTEIPAHIRDIFVAARGVYRREDVQTIFQYLKAHPDVLVGFLPKTYAVPIIALRLIQSWFNLPDDRGQVPLGDDYVNVGADGNGRGRCCFTSSMCNGTKAYRFKQGEKSANARKASVRGGMSGSGNGVEVNIKYAKLPKALQPTEEDLHPTPVSRNIGGVRRRRMPKESYEGYQDQENDVYTHRGGLMEGSPLIHSEMLQDKALGLLKGMPRRIGVEDPKFKPQKQ